MLDPAVRASDGQGSGAGPWLLEAQGIVKRFGELTANDHVDLRVAPGEIHALLGENGAGKSTLVKILYGALHPDAGSIRWRGEPVRIETPAEARRLGIGMVFQHFSLFEALTVAENVALALESRDPVTHVARRLTEVADAYGLPLRPERSVGTLSVGERQRVEILRCLLQDPSLVIMDEPTSVLTPQEAERLFEVLDRLAAQGRAVLYISHRLEEVKRLCHRATILRSGRVVADCDPRRETAASLARLMIGSDVRAVSHSRRAVDGPPRLVVRDLSLPTDDPFGVPLEKVSLEARGGEVLAIAGIAGNGQGELFAALSGEVPTAPDAILLDGRPVGRLDAEARRRLGAAFVPEERLGHAAVPRLPLGDNVALTRRSTAKLTWAFFLLSSRARALAETVVRSFDVRKAGPNPEAGSLSGGNLQKFVVGREILAKPKVLVVNQPTWGVDAGASALIRQALIDLAEEGAAVVVISQDLDEILAIADRIAVISRGRLSRAHARGEVTLERIGLLMGGSHAGEEAADAA